MMEQFQSGLVRAIFVLWFIFWKQKQFSIQFKFLRGLIFKSWKFYVKKYNQFPFSTLECVKVPTPAHQVLPLTGYILEASYSTSATQTNKI